MAANYQVLGSFATVQVTSPTTVVDVLRITAKTIPSGITFYANAPYRSIVGVPITGQHITPAQVDEIANVFIEPLAAGIERMMGSGQVAYAVAVEDIDRSGLLIDYIDATVSYPSPSTSQPGPFEQTVRIPTNAFDEPSFYDPLIGQPINDAYNALEDLAHK